MEIAKAKPLGNSSQENRCDDKESNESLKSALLNMNLSIPILESEDFEYSSVNTDRGGFGTIHNGVWLGTPVKVKRIKQKKDNKWIIREVQTLERIRHPNIVSIMAISVEFDSACLILMENIEGETLHRILFYSEIVRKFNLNLVKRNHIGIQLARALAFMHGKSPAIFHKDVKPENVMVSTNLQLKLVDMGPSKCENMAKILATTAGNVLGTSYYLAPEQILFKKSGQAPAESWAFACCLVELYSEDWVWKDLVNTSLDIREQVKMLFKENTKPDTSEIPKKLKYMIDLCFDYDPSNRPKISTVLDIYRTMSTDPNQDDCSESD